MWGKFRKNRDLFRTHAAHARPRQQRLLSRPRFRGGATFPDGSRSQPCPAGTPGHGDPPRQRAGRRRRPAALPDAILSAMGMGEEAIAG